MYKTATTATMPTQTSTANTLPAMAPERTELSSYQPHSCPSVCNMQLHVLSLSYKYVSTEKSNGQTI